MNWMPLLGTGLAMPMDALNEAQAQRNHFQSLEQLAKRGGLSPEEALAVLEHRQYHGTTRSLPESLRALIKALDSAEGKMPRMVWEAQASLSNPCTQVYFRAGLLACREYMARFVEAESPSIAASIRANWWPQLGEDPGPPRLLDWNEIADGGEEGPWTAKAISPQREGLPTALQFLEASK